MINEYLSPYGPMKNEGDVLIGEGNERFVLECHESGPEIIVYLLLTTASLNLVKSIIELVIALLKALQKDNHKSNGKIILLKRRFVKSDVLEEEIMAVELPLNESTINKLNNKITQILEK